MTLGALLDLGVPREVIAGALDQVGVGGARISPRQVIKRGVRAVHLSVDASLEGSPWRKSPGAAPSAIRYADIEALIAAPGMDPAVAARALDMFGRVVRAEARLHCTAGGDVLFEEEEAIDSLIDIVGAAAGLAWLAPVSVTAASVTVGYGTFHSTEGIKPVPSPAALEILRERGAILEGGPVAMELCTATGAAILAGAVTEWMSMPRMTPLAAGYGAGSADLADRANVLRITVGERVAP
jgi:uncharacterized protein (DUF111 family)